MNKYLILIRKHGHEINFFSEYVSEWPNKENAKEEYNYLNQKRKEKRIYDLKLCKIIKQC